MIVYVESNFVLEFVLLQEQSDSCEQLIGLAESRRLELVVPAYSLVEPYETMERRQRERLRLAEDASAQLRLLRRSKPFSGQVSQLTDVAKLLAESGEIEEANLGHGLKRLLDVARIVPLTNAVLRRSTEVRVRLGLTGQDSVVYASVLCDLEEARPDAACFLNRNSQDFEDPDIQDELARLQCKLIPRFDRGVDYARSRVGA